MSFYRGIPVYVGKGVGKRWIHTVNGKSNNDLINYFYFNHTMKGDMPLETYIVKRYATSKEALHGESLLISKFLPYCNKCSGRSHSDSYDFEEKLIDVCRSKGYDFPESLYSKFDFRFLFTPFGLFCTSVNLSENSPFEYADKQYHIRIKKEFLTEFPENFLQYMKHDSDLSGEFISSFHNKPLALCTAESGDISMFKDLNVDIDWMVSALCGESLNFADEFGFECRELNVEKFKYINTVMDAHVKLYSKHKEIIRKKELSKERSKAKREKKKLQKLNAINGSVSNSDLLHPSEHVNLTIKNPKLDFFSVKVDSDTIEFSTRSGIKVSGFGDWLNISVDVKPFRSLGSLSKYPTITKEKFLSLDLHRYKKE